MTKKEREILKIMGKKILYNAEIMAREYEATHGETPPNERLAYKLGVIEAQLNRDLYEYIERPGLL